MCVGFTALTAGKADCFNRGDTCGNLYRSADRNRYHKPAKQCRQNNRSCIKRQMKSTGKQGKPDCTPQKNTDSNAGPSQETAFLFDNTADLLGRCADGPQLSIALDLVIDRDPEDTLYHHISSDDDQNCDAGNQRQHTDIHRLLIEFHIAEVHDRHFQLIFLCNLPAAGSQFCFIHLLLILKMHIGTIISGVIAAPSFQGFFGKKDGRSIYLFFLIAFHNASHRVFSVKALAA